MLQLDHTKHQTAGVFILLGWNAQGRRVFRAAHDASVAKIVVQDGRRLERAFFPRNTRKRQTPYLRVHERVPALGNFTMDP